MSGRYVYTVYNKKGFRVNVTDNFDKVLVDKNTLDHVDVWDGVKNKEYCTLVGWQLEEFRNTLERNVAWVPETPLSILQENAARLTLGEISGTKKPDPISPSHYKSYISLPEFGVEMQWLEAMQYLPHFRNPEHFLAAVELQVRKYLDRLGKKDNDSQELKKSKWYLTFMIKYIENGKKPIRIKDIPELN